MSLSVELRGPLIVYYIKSPEDKFMLEMLTDGLPNAARSPNGLSAVIVHDSAAIAAIDFERIKEVINSFRSEL